MEPIPPYVPLHRLAGTNWGENWADRSQRIHWGFDEGTLQIRFPPGRGEIYGDWSVEGDRVEISVPEAEPPITWQGICPPVLSRGVRLILESVAVNGSGNSTATRKELEFLTQLDRDTGRGSREWDYYWNWYVPRQGQADTVQGEILRITCRLASMYYQSGGAGWCDGPETYEAYVDVAFSVLCDGTLDTAANEFAKKTLIQFHWYCTAPTESIGPSPEFKDLERLNQLAVEWCRYHPMPILREPDPRMRF